MRHECNIKRRKEWENSKLKLITRKSSVWVEQKKKSSNTEAAFSSESDLMGENSRSSGLRQLHESFLHLPSREQLPRERICLTEKPINSFLAAPHSSRLFGDLLSKQIATVEVRQPSGEEEVKQIVDLSLPFGFWSWAWLRIANSLFSHHDSIHLQSEFIRKDPEIKKTFSSIARRLFISNAKMKLFAYDHKARLIQKFWIKTFLASILRKVFFVLKFQFVALQKFIWKTINGMEFLCKPKSYKFFR